MNNCPSKYLLYFQELRDTLNIPHNVAVHLHYEDMRNPDPDCESDDIMSAGSMGRLNDHEFEITLHDGLGDFDEVETIAHEFKHIEQMISGRLTYTMDGFVWDGMSIKLIDNYNPDDYSRLPHEIDARIFQSHGLEIASNLGLI